MPVATPGNRAGEVDPGLGGSLAAPQVAFGDFVLDLARRRLLRANGAALDVAPRLFSALELFVGRPGELIDKDTLMQTLWPGRVVEENSLSQLVHSLRRALGDDGAQHRYIQTEARRGFRLVVPVEHRAAADSSRNGTTRSDGAPRSTLAVLPFVSLTAQPVLELLEVGMADSLIARLSTVPGLVLRSVGSVRRFAEQARDLSQAARALDAAWLLDGTLQVVEDRLRVSARLLSMPSGVAAWSGSFNVAIVHVFDLQDVISEQVAHALAAPLGGQAPQAPDLTASRLGGTRDIDAYQLYLAGNQHAQGVRADGLARSIELYRQALALDAGYALAHVGIAESSRRMVFGADAEPRQALDAPRQHVLQALAIAPDLVEAHAQLAWIHYWYDYDWGRAEQVFRRALELNPNVAHAHFGLGFMLVTLGRVDEGLAHARTAHELDPLSPLYETMRAAFVADGGDPAAATARLARLLLIEPRFWIAHLVLAAIAMKAGDLDRALPALERSEAMADRSTQPAALLGVALARMGRADDARAVLARLQALAATRYVPPTSPAAVLAALGDSEAALDALERAFEVRDTRLTYLKDDVRWHSLRGTPRFRALLERMQLHRHGPGLNGP